MTIPVYVRIRIFGRWVTVWKYHVRRRTTFRPTDKDS